MRIVIDHSGYDLMNLGDIAMLQACTTRLRRLVPDAELTVICQNAARLRQFCPDAMALEILAPHAGERATLARVGRVGLQARRILAPVRHVGGWGRIRPLTEAIRGADAVVASGGGYINDVFWWHGSGVLSSLQLAQRHKKPTAMFGQGLGPLSNPFVTRQAKRVFPHLSILGLREGRESLPLARRLRAETRTTRCTGDEALLLARPATADRSKGGDAVGLNLRTAAYTGTDREAGRAVARGVALAAPGVRVVVLPVSQYVRQSDSDSTTEALEESGLGFVENRPQGPQHLVADISQCAAVVTSSYHAAVFACAQGIPAVCLVGSPYYGGKFGGLLDLFPGNCTLVNVDSRDLADTVRSALARALATSEGDRATTVEAVAQMVRSQDDVYREFCDLLVA